MDEGEGLLQLFLKLDEEEAEACHEIFGPAQYFVRPD